MKAIIQVGDLFVTDYHRGAYNSGDICDVVLRGDMAMIFRIQYIVEEVALACHGNIVYIEPPVED